MNCNDCKHSTLLLLHDNTEASICFVHDQKGMKRPAANECQAYHEREMIAFSDFMDSVKAVYPFFFSKKTMKFFGDKVTNFGLRIVTINDGSEWIEVYELFRMKSVNHGNHSSFFFRTDTFERVGMVKNESNSGLLCSILNR